MLTLANLPRIVSLGLSNLIFQQLSKSDVSLSRGISYGELTQFRCNDCSSKHWCMITVFPWCHFSLTPSAGNTLYDALILTSS
jgi:hypothetical protein